MNCFIDVYVCVFANVRARELWGILYIAELRNGGWTNEKPTQKQVLVCHVDSCGVCVCVGSVERVQCS